MLNPKRITLLKTTDFEVEHSLRSYKIVEFPSVFKSTDEFAVDLFKPEPSMVEHPAGSDLTEDSEHSTVHDGPENGQSSNSSISDKLPIAQPPRIGANKARNTKAKGVSTDGATRPSAKQSSTWNPNRAIVLLNLNDERIDAALGKLDPEAERSLRKRGEQGRPCHDYHLRGVCYTSSCAYNHEPRLSPQEMVALRHRARNLPCVKGSSCRAPDCWYGHMCPTEDCSWPNTCRFRAHHDMDRTAVTVWQKSGQRAWLPRENNEYKGTGSLLDDSLRL